MENQENVDLEEVDIVDASENEVETEEQQENTKTYSQEDVDEMIKEIHKKNQDAWNRRWGQEKSKMERDNAKKDELIKLLSEQTQANSVDDLLNNAYEQYGVERPKISNKRDDEILGKHDAKEILELDLDMIQEEAERLSKLKRSDREEATFLELGKYLTEKKKEAQRIKEIKENGFDEEIVNSDSFKDFSKKFSDKTSLKDIYDIYAKTNGTQKAKPFSAGSANGKAVKEVSEFFTVEEFNALTEEDLKDDRVYEKAMKTMAHFS